MLLQIVFSERGFVNNGFINVVWKFIQLIFWTFFIENILNFSLRKIEGCKEKNTPLYKCSYLFWNIHITLKFIFRYGWNSCIWFFVITLYHIPPSFLLRNSKNVHFLKSSASVSSGVDIQEDKIWEQNI